MLSALLFATIQQDHFPLVSNPMVRPPAVPLVAHDPYFSIWSPGDQLTDKETIHWTGRPQPLNCLVRIDGKTYRLMGVEPKGTPALHQTDRDVWPTRTVCGFTNHQVSVKITFLTPALPSNLEWLSRPATYLIWDTRSEDKQKHSVQIYFDCGGQIAVDTVDQAVNWSQPNIQGLSTARVGTMDQPILAKRGDDLRIDWGYGYLSAPKTNRTTVTTGPGESLRNDFIQNGRIESAKNGPRKADQGVLTYAIDLGTIQDKTTQCHAILAYDDEYSIRYFGRQLRPFWRQSGMDAPKMLQKAEKEFKQIQPLCETFDVNLLRDLEKAGGKNYAAVCSLVYRQTLAANKIAADANGKPLVFPKENFSNGCIATVDVLYPQAPFYLMLSPELTKGMLRPILDYAGSTEWPYNYAPHDLGTYPHATGQVYGMGGNDGDRMPVEECGNMLIMLAALAKVEGNSRFAEPYMPLLKKWTDYLVKEGLDPANQLCSADMFGHLPHSANLALKTVIGISAYANLCSHLKLSEEAQNYQKIAREYAQKWQKLSADGDHPRLAYDQPGTWSMMHNLIWDRIIGTEVFPRSLSNQVIAHYQKVQQPFGLPVDSRTQTSLIDWATWSIAVAPDRNTFIKMFDPIYAYVNQTPSRIPLSDWYSTVDAKQVGFQARSVIGGIYIMPLLDPKTVYSWTVRAQTILSDWAPFPSLATIKEVAPTARKQAVDWKYTFTYPGNDWAKSTYADAEWKTGQAGFGTDGTPGAIVRTAWNTSDIWLRRTFTLKAGQLKNPVLIVHYDENPEIYINGVLVARPKGWTTGYEMLELSAEAQAALHTGVNTLAVHCHQTTGGQYIDVGLGEEEMSPKPNVK